MHYFSAPSERQKHNRQKRKWIKDTQLELHEHQNEVKRYSTRILSAARFVHVHRSISGAGGACFHFDILLELLFGLFRAMEMHRTQEPIIQNRIYCLNLVLPKHAERKRFDCSGLSQKKTTEIHSGLKTGSQFGFFVDVVPPFHHIFATIVWSDRFQFQAEAWSN